MIGIIRNLISIFFLFCSSHTKVVANKQENRSLPQSHAVLHGIFHQGIPGKRKAANTHFFKRIPGLNGKQVYRELVDNAALLDFHSSTPERSLHISTSNEMTKRPRFIIRMPFGRTFYFFEVG